MFSLLFLFFGRCVFFGVGRDFACDILHVYMYIYRYDMYLFSFLEILLNENQFDDLKPIKTPPISTVLALTPRILPWCPSVCWRASLLWLKHGWYNPLNSHDIETSSFLIGDTSSNGCFSMFFHCHVFFFPGVYKFLDLCGAAPNVNAHAAGLPRVLMVALAVLLQMQRGHILLRQRGGEKIWNTHRGELKRSWSCILKLVLHPARLTAGTWEYGPPGKGKASSKPAFSGSMLIFGGVFKLMVWTWGWNELQGNCKIEQKTAVATFL